MIELASVQTPLAALVAGAVTSLHCAGMCGPLACWLTPVRPEDDATVLASLYQGGRLTSYSLLGALAGGLGRMPLEWVHPVLLTWFPWILVVFLLVLGTGLEKRLPRPLVLARAMGRVQGWLRGKPRTVTAVTLGLATPLLPCGPLYFLTAVAAFSGSAVTGAEFMLCFALGTLPLLWWVQSQFGRWSRRLPLGFWPRLRSALALLTAVILAWRLHQYGGTEGNWSCFG